MTRRAGVISSEKSNSRTSPIRGDRGLIESKARADNSLPTVGSSLRLVSCRGVLELRRLPSGSAAARLALELKILRTNNFRIPHGSIGNQQILIPRL